MMRHCTGTLVFLLLFASCPLWPAARLQKAGFSVVHDGIGSSARIQTIMVLPGEPVTFTLAGRPDARYRVEPAIAAAPSGSSEWRIQPPDSAGVYPYTVRQLHPADSIRLHLIVMVPYDQQKSLDGYNIGSYPKLQLGKLWGGPPAGMIKVTPANESLYVSPHFRLRQFLCKQAGGFPKYLVLQEKLLHKLELIIDRLVEKKFPEAALVIMSGYRTPAYNRGLGNGAYSQHCWGGAADIYIDSDQDGHMDDLNRDGRCDFHDAETLYQWIAGWTREPVFASLLGGLARYRRTNSHGPFVHVDVRGVNASWGE